MKIRGNNIMSNTEFIKSLFSKKATLIFLFSLTFFTINAQYYFIFTSPEYKEEFYIGDEVVFKWTDVDNVGGEIDVTLKGPGGTSWEWSFPQENSGEFSWTPTSSHDPGLYQLFIWHTTSGKMGISDYFVVKEREEPIEVTSPTSSTEWELGESNVSIRWNGDESGGNVSIILRDQRGSDVDVIISQTSNDGSYTTYDVPEDIAPGEYLVRVYKDGGNYDDSDPFEIIDPLGDITVMTPNGSTNWKLGQINVPITWNTGGLDGNVSIELYKGSIRKGIPTSAIANSGSYNNYDVPNSLITGDDYSIVITSLSHAEKSDPSDPFTISENVVLGNLQVSMSNVANGSTSIPGSNGRIELVNFSGETIDSQTTNSSGVAYFNDVIVGTDYTAYAYHNPSVTIHGEEFWGKASNITVSESGSSPISIVRYMPYITNVDFYNDETSEKITTLDIPIGTSVRAEIQIQNNGGALNARTWLLMDGDKVGNPDLQFTSESLAVSGNASQTYTISFSSEVEGDYYFTVRTESDYSYFGGFVNTDGWNWSNSTIAFVDPTSQISLPDFSVTNPAVTPLTLQVMNGVPQMKVDWSCSVANIGDTRASISKLGVYVSSSSSTLGSLVDETNIASPTNAALGLNNGDTYTDSKSFTFPQELIPSGLGLFTFYIHFKADYLDDATEINESNNSTYKSIEVNCSSFEPTTVKRTNPSNEDNYISEIGIDEDLKVFFTQNLNEASINNSSVIAKISEGDEIGTTLSYDDEDLLQAANITVDFNQSLSGGQFYEVDINNLLLDEFGSFVQSENYILQAKITDNQFDHLKELLDNTVLNFTTGFNISNNKYDIWKEIENDLSKIDEARAINASYLENTGFLSPEILLDSKKGPYYVDNKAYYVVMVQFTNYQNIKDYEDAVWDGVSLVADDDIAFKVFLTYKSSSSMNYELFNDYDNVLEIINVIQTLSNVMVDVRDAAFKAILSAPGTQKEVFAKAYIEQLLSVGDIPEKIFELSLRQRNLELQDEFEAGKIFAETTGQSPRIHYNDASYSFWLKYYLPNDGDFFVEMTDKFSDERGDLINQFSDLAQIAKDKLFESIILGSELADLKNSYKLIKSMYETASFIEDCFSSYNEAQLYLDKIKDEKEYKKGYLYNRLSYPTMATVIASLYEHRSNKNLNIYPDNLWNFGPEVINSYKEQKFILTNDGLDALSITDISISGTEASQFSIVRPTSTSFEIPAGSSQEVIVRFSPTSIGGKTASLSITNNSDNASPVKSISLSGTGIENATSILSLTPDMSYDFGNVTQNGQVDKSFILSNQGTASLLVTDISITGTQATQFSIVSPSSTSFEMPAGSSQEMIVRFSPTTIGGKTASLSITNDSDNASPVKSISLSGTGIENATSILSMTPDMSYDFGNVTKNGQVAKSFLLSNQGTASLSITDISITGTQATQFSIVSPSSTSYLPEAPMK